MCVLFSSKLHGKPLIEAFMLLSSYERLAPVNERLEEEKSIKFSTAKFTTLFQYQICIHQFSIKQIMHT